MERDRGWTRFRRKLRSNGVQIQLGGNENQNGMPSTTSTEDNNKVQTMGGRRNVGGEKRSGRVLSRIKMPGAVVGDDGLVEPEEPPRC